MKGKTVAILETRAGDRIAGLVRKYGGFPLLAPALAEVPDIDPAFIAALMLDLEAKPAQFFVFQTGVGTRALFAAADSLGITERLLRLLDAARVVARGPKPAAALRARNVRIDLAAGDPFTTREVLAELRDAPLRGTRVVVQRYGEPNLELRAALEGKGAEVIEIATYRWGLPEDTAPLERLIEALGRREVDLVAFTSASQADNLFAVARENNAQDMLRRGLEQTLIASIGPVCSAALRELRVRIDIEAHPPKLGPFIDAINRTLSGAPGF